MYSYRQIFEKLDNITEQVVQATNEFRGIRKQLLRGLHHQYQLKNSIPKKVNREKRFMLLSLAIVPISAIAVIISIIGYIAHAVK